jgi:O-antigen/teichoic acid export membrane protein
MLVAPRLQTAGRHAELQRVLTRTVRVVLVFAVPTALVLVVFGRLILGVFGTGFEDGETSIRILTAGEVVNVLTGFGGLVLVMTGHERELALCVGLGTALNVALTATLVPLAGLEGAAIGTAAGLAASNLAMASLAWKRLGIWSPIVSRPRRALA